MPPSTLPPEPVQNASLPAAHPSPQFLAFLATRRSTPAAKLGPEGPDADQLADLLRIAARVPDHGKLAPWRFIVFEGEARAAAGALIEARALAREPGLDNERRAQERGRLLRAPVVVSVVSRADPAHPKIPEWEQILSAGAVCQNLLLAAQAMGFAGVWLTDWISYDADLRAAFGLAPTERIAGWMYLGSPPEATPERPRPDVAALTTRWSPPAL